MLQMLRDSLHLPGVHLGSLLEELLLHPDNLLEELLLHLGSLLEVHLVWGMTCSLKLQNLCHSALVLFPQH